jgi:hypothetical protein
LDRFLIQTLLKNPSALANINWILFGAATSMVVASKLMERQHIPYVRYIWL